MIGAIQDGKCRLIGHCEACRESMEFRLKARLPEECPHGVTRASLSNPGGIGTLIEMALKPIAKALRLQCINSSGKLRPESGCAKRRNLLNGLTAPKK